MSDDKKKDGPGFIGAVKNYFNSYTDTDASLRSGSPYAPTTQQGWDEYEARKKAKGSEAQSKAMDDARRATGKPPKDFGLVYDSWDEYDRRNGKGKKNRLQDVEVK